jgi:hypothetical protein
MRTIRGLVTAAAFFALLPQAAAAQQGRPFKDAWFWGLKTGGLAYSTLAESNQVAGLVGAEWLITRTRGGLYIAYDHSFFDRTTQIVELDEASGDATLRDVELRNMRRVTIAAMGFPQVKWRGVRPYAGLGTALNQIASATPLGEFTTVEQLSQVNRSITARKVSFAPILIFGGQAELRRLSAFGQLSATASHDQFFLYQPGKGFNTTLEFGVRYNIGSSIER